MAVKTGNDVIPDRQTANLVRRAIREGWDVPQEYRDAAKKVVASMLADKNQHPRNRLAAVKQLGDFDRITLEAERLELDREKFERGAEQAPAQIIINTHEPPQPEPLPAPEEQ